MLDTKATVYIVDDDQAVRDSLSWLIESINIKVEVYSSAQDFLDHYKPEYPGCLVADVRMPGISGLELQKILKEKNYSIPMILITGHGDVPMAVRALKNGAVDFIEKPFNDQVLLERVNQCLEKDQNDRVHNKDLQSKMSLLATLSPREREVLDQVVIGKQNKIIAADLGISNKTVEAHRANVMEKMRVSSLADLVALYVSCGLYKGKP
ncbi:MAG: response regulator transcription factor [Gammaproteobacteria bacterium]